MKAPQKWLALFGEGETWRGLNSDKFRSDESLRWFFRSHKKTLIERDAVRFARNRWMATENMTPVVDAIAKECAQRMLADAE